MKAQLRRVTDGEATYTTVVFWCPAPNAARRSGECGLHMLPTGSAPPPRKNWTLIAIDPLHLEPSVLRTGDDGYRCHTMVRYGHIEYLADCTHSLAGQTVPVPDLPDWVTRGRS